MTQYSNSIHYSQAFLYLWCLGYLYDAEMEIKQKIADWIKAARAEAGLSGEQLGARLSLELGNKRGNTRANISHWETEKHEPSLQQILAIAKITGKPLPPEVTGVVDEPNTTPGPEIRGDVPVISWVAAGNWSPVSDPYVSGVAEIWLPCPKNHSKGTFALRVRGVSMENPGGKHTYSDGDVIFVDPAKHYENGSRVIVRLDDKKEATFKQLVIEGDKKYLKALNPAWPEKIIAINGNATICGVVIGKWTDE